MLWGRELTFIEGSPCASDSPALISHLIFTKTSCSISSSHSAPGEMEDLWFWCVWSRESIKENHRKDSGDYFAWKLITLFRISNLFWSCQYLALNLLIPIREGLGWRKRRVYQNHPPERFQDTLDPASSGKVGQYRRKSNTIPSLPRERIKSKDSMSPIRKVLHAFVQVTFLKVQMQECFHFICPKGVPQSSNLDCWDISSHAFCFHNDILVFLIQPHPYTLKILILPWCLHISNICSPLKRYRAHREIEVHIWKT